MEKDDIDKKFFDMVCEAGTSLHGTDRTTIPKLLEVYQSEPNPIAGFSVLLLHIKRQENRRELKGNVRTLISHLQYIRNKYMNDSQMFNRMVIKYLTLLKWVHETAPKKIVETLEEFITGE